MTIENQTLWLKIATYPLDDSMAQFSFSKKLAQAQNWSEAYTQRAIIEYKKFMFLCISSPNGASPSKNVDEVWHLHLTYSEHYARFCEAVAGKFIHHHPSKGGADEYTRHQNWHIETLKNYCLAFDELPPTDIWQVPIDFTPPQYLSQKSVFQALRAEPFESHTAFLGEETGLTTSFLIAISLLVSMFLGILIQISGEKFLMLAVPHALTALYFLYVSNEKFKTLLRTRFELLGDKLNTYYLAYIVKGKNRVLQTLVLEAAEAGVFRLPEEGDHLEISDKTLFNEQLKGHLLAFSMQAHEGDVVSKDFLSQTADGLSRHIQRELDRTRLLDIPTHWQQYIYWVSLGVLLFRIFQGLANHQAVGFLVVITIIFCIFGAFVLFNVKQFYETYFASLDTQQQMATQYAINGRSALAKNDCLETALIVAHISTDWQRADKSSGSEGSYSFSCGGSSDGGGDGCGGGGCGGCGGGD